MCSPRSTDIAVGDLRIDGDRLWQSLVAMAEIGATAGGGSNRLALSDEDGAARRLLARWCEEAGAAVRGDKIGNMFARREGSDPSRPPVVIGSHLDTQPMGGRFDGVLGVLSALEVLRIFGDHDIDTRNPVELVNWTNEEGARFAPAMVGSGVWSGQQSLETALDARDSGGARFGDELSRTGFAGAYPAQGRPIRAYFEVHIEQGPILQSGGFDVGVVTHAQGVRWFDVRITGSAGHAGTTPMDARRDALIGASGVIDAVRKVAGEHGPEAVATVGRISVEPGSRNVIPGSARLTIDARHPDSATLERMALSLRVAAQEVCAALKLGVEIEEVLAFAPTKFDTDCVSTVRDAARLCGYRFRNIVSGGGHDACNVQRIAPAAMIFTPCVGGLSHTEAEDITPEWAAAGANVLLHAVLATAESAA